MTEFMFAVPHGAGSFFFAPVAKAVLGGVP